MHNSVKLVSISTVVPDNIIEQKEVAIASHQYFSGRFNNYERIARVFENSGIRKRHSIRPLEWYVQPLGWKERGNAYIEGATKLFIKAAQKALDNAGLKAANVDTIVTVSSTGIATPSLDARAADTMGFRADIERIPVFGLGCAGGVTGMSIAARLAQSRPDSVVLLVAVELCTLAFRMDELTKANIVATAIFADGAAACIFRTQETGLAEYEIGGQHTWPRTLDIMGWSIDPQGFGVIFDRAIPPFAREHFLSAITSILAHHNISLEDIDRFVCHPGGSKVIDSLEYALSLDEGTLNHERNVLSDYGNMSAPTALFVLERAIQSGLPKRTLITALGPGFTATCVSLKSAT